MGVHVFPILNPPAHLPPHPIPVGHPSAPAPRTLYHASNLWFISHVIIYIFQCHSPKSSHPCPLLQSPKNCSIHLCLFCCLTYRVIVAAAAAAKSLQSCLTLYDPRDGSPPGSPIPGILRARTLEWVAISFSNAWKWKVKVKSLSRVRLFTTPWTAAHQAPPSMGFSRQEYWSGMPLHIHRRCILSQLLFLLL